MTSRPQKKDMRLKQWRDKVWNFVSRPYHALSPAKRFWFGFGLLCIVTTLLIQNPLWRTLSEPAYKIGDIARESMISPADIHFVDEQQTEMLRQAARDSIKPIFSFEPKRADEAVQNFRLAWDGMQRRAENAAANKSNSNGRADNSWPGPDGEEAVKVFTSRRFTSNEIEAVTRVLRENAAGDIYGDQDTDHLQGEISLVDRQRPTDSRQALSPAATMVPLSEARENLRRGLVQIRSLSEKESSAFFAVTSPLVQPSVIFDAVATDNARRAIAADVVPETVTLKRSQKVVNEGELITAQKLSEINAIRNYAAGNRKINRFIGLLILISALYWMAWKFIEHRGVVPRLALSEKETFALFGFVAVVQTVLMAVFFTLAEYTASQNVRAPMSDPGLWAFAVPFAFGSLLMNMLADRRTALFTGLFTALIAGFLAPRGLEFAVYAGIASAVSVYGIGAYRSRQTVTIAGVLTGVSSALMAVALIAYTQQPFILNTVLLAIACGLAGGVITAAVTAMFLPVCESLFGILTDVKLLELSNADLPALGQLAMRAPGTNQHSHAVGQLAEEACRAVGANGLLARIGALYHDIGKTAAPEHFVENQMGKNPHDRLKPVQSAKIIVSHVTYGIKLGKEMGLPQRIIDFIPQHHGTRTLHYFLKKAQGEARPDEEVAENDFRYPGPKPQFKEAAIMMIADSCEAGARSLAEPTPENVRFIVTKIIDAILSDDQLDECDLTLRELTQIREAMIRSLVAIYHSRVDYPGYVPPNSSSQIMVPAHIDSEERGMKFSDPADIPVSPGGEIEDEAIITPAKGAAGNK